MRKKEEFTGKLGKKNQNAVGGVLDQSTKTNSRDPYEKEHVFKTWKQHQAGRGEGGKYSGAGIRRRCRPKKKIDRKAEF